MTEDVTSFFKSSPCSEMMEFYFQILKFDSTNVID